MSWELYAYLIWWVAYLLVVPRWSYRNPAIAGVTCKDPALGPLNSADSGRTSNRGY